MEKSRVAKLPGKSRRNNEHRLLGGEILPYFLASRLEICDFNAPVLVREKLVFEDSEDARRFPRADLPPLLMGLIWSTSVVLERLPLAFS